MDGFLKFKLLFITPWAAEYSRVGFKYCRLPGTCGPIRQKNVFLVQVQVVISNIANLIHDSSKHDMRIWNFKNPSADSWDMTRDYIYGHHCISDFWSTCWRLTTIKCADLNRYTFSSMFSHEKVTLFKSEHFIGNLLYCNLKVKVLRDLVMFASAQFKVWSENIIYYCYTYNWQ